MRAALEDAARALDEKANHTAGIWRGWAGRDDLFRSDDNHSVTDGCYVEKTSEAQTRKNSGRMAGVLQRLEFCEPPEDSIKT
jgi:hypothetical protein